MPSMFTISRLAFKFFASAEYSHIATNCSLRQHLDPNDPKDSDRNNDD